MKLNLDNNMSLSWLKEWKSPPEKASTFRGIPIENLRLVREDLKCERLSYRIVYRGPRGGNVYNTPKALATSFDVYIEFPETVKVNGLIYKLVRP